MSIIKGLIASLLLLTLGIAHEKNEGQEIIIAVAPTYPLGANMARVGGMVEVEIVVNDVGNVISTNGVDKKSSDYIVFGAASERAALKWKFIKTSNNINRKYTLSFYYKIMPPNTPNEDITTIYRSPYSIEVRCGTHENIKLDHPDTDVKYK
jgi:TonB family protein